MCEDSSLRNARILVIEDEGLEAQLAIDVLQRHGTAAVKVAATVQTALALLAAESFDCVIFDLELDGFFSYGMAFALKDAGIPFMFCTAHADLVADFINVPKVDKPYTEEVFLAAVQACLNLKPSGKASEPADGQAQDGQTQEKQAPG